VNQVFNSYKDDQATERTHLGSACFERDVEERKRGERIREEMVNFFCLEHRRNRRDQISVGPTPFLLLLKIAKKLRRKVFSITFPILPLFLLKQ
jgi:hypothetical protein